MIDCLISPIHNAKNVEYFALIINLNSPKYQNRQYFFLDTSILIEIETTPKSIKGVYKTERVLSHGAIGLFSCKRCFSLLFLFSFQCLFYSDKFLFVYFVVCFERKSIDRDESLRRSVIECILRSVCRKFYVI